MTLKHTPGPWTLGEDGKIVGPRGDTVAFAYDADAQLITTTPDLLALAKWVVESLEDFETDFKHPTNGDGSMLATARAAIARAKVQGDD